MVSADGFKTAYSRYVKAQTALLYILTAEEDGALFRD